MGNNPSRASAQPQQQHHLDRQHSTPTSPPIANVPARAASTSSSRTIINRRNSLQPAPSKHTSTSASVPPEDPLTLPIRHRNEPASAVEEPYMPQGRRESIAEAISSVPWTINHTAPRPTPGFDDDDALTSPTLRKLQTANSTPTVAGEDLPSREGTPLSAGSHADPLTKRGSMGSTTTIDEEEVDVADTRTIPTLIQWLQGGHKKKKRYTNEIPAYLRDFDDGGEDGHRIGNDDGDIPAPPSLPMMLQKVILNTSSAMKDDASVLGIPNHVVLNHLATSSIKNQVLAVSATTRYRKKYVTTILYKSTTE
ncbi:AMPKBI-domain-containing protein [Tuber magnatum]|uniref:AMPKBI-domain-containing protein n=1 Tax=Tuber magnatum TaxID=42249 RepID=A0A317SIZ2_9PEZI|nr:AMPKBI-domain-containing protein [Tuber magnatum]